MLSAPKKLFGTAMSRARMSSRFGSLSLGTRKTFVPQARGLSSMSGGKYATEMYNQWRADPASVHPSWAVMFQSGNTPTNTAGGMDIIPQSGSSTLQQVMHLIRAYQVRGHEQANLDPLGIQTAPQLAELDISSYGFSEADLQQPLGLGEISSISGVLANATASTTLGEVIKILEATYCGPVGYEYMHIPNRDQCNWLRAKIEVLKAPREKPWRKQQLERLVFSERFEVFLANKWNTTKRFGIEGVESMIVGLKTAIDTSTKLGVEEIVMGMPHRGRLNVLTNVIRKPLEQIFKEFAGTNVPADSEECDWAASGDVKYHLGTSFDRSYPDGRHVHLSMMANPSHLEAVNPLVVGKARAKMHALGDETGHKVMGVIIHGDAAFAGQGIVYEQMQMSKLPNYHTGGTLHVIANNQVGFTTDPGSSRSTKYCSDLGKTFNCPIFHVNADFPEHVAEVFEIAAEWRQKFHTDVIIDIVGYRKHGHNELDQPMFTQPMLYSVVKKHPSPLTKHAASLVAEGAFVQAEIDEVVAMVDQTLANAFEASKTYESPKDLWLNNAWANISSPNEFSEIQMTGVELDSLRHVGKHLTTMPEGFTLHRQIGKIYEAKSQAIEAEANIDWGTAEALAFGSLLQQGTHVRLSGEDVERGTFSHRHAVVHDQKTGTKFEPLNNIPGNQQSLTVCNSPLSEYGVLGFDLGYSLNDPNQLVMWEAQFGDFVNGAQIIIDQFLSSGETKWLRQTGLVMLLPHGYDGLGPDHSSCRIERFLQSCDEDPDSVPEMEGEVRTQIQRSNWQIVNCTTPANYFHVLRRQVVRKFRKPLIMISPKNMLKLRDCQSSLSEMQAGTKFVRAFGETYPEELVAPEEVRRLLLCSGKVYYELLNQRRKNGAKDVAICRVEQIHPFPFDLVAKFVETYPNAEVVWMQEEPKNMGCWQFAQDRIVAACKNILDKQVLPAYVGRGTMAATAEGYGAVHARTQAAILELALSDEVTTKFVHR